MVADGQRLSAAEERKQAARMKGALGSRFHYAHKSVEKLVAGWPPFTPEQRQALALLFYPGDDAVNDGEG
jgi:hypothetical protein